MGQRIYNIDAEMIFKDAGAIAASAAALVGGVAQIIAVGQARFEGVMIIDATAIEIASNDEEYQVIVQGSTSATFASDIQNLARMDFGATEVRDGGAVDSLAGRYELAFCNEQADIVYPYLRLYTLVAGAIAGGGGINYTAYADRVTWG